MSDAVEATPDAMAAAGVDITHHFVTDEVYSKRAHVKAGCRLVQHIHPYDTLQRW